MKALACWKNLWTFQLTTINMIKTKQNLHFFFPENETIMYMSKALNHLIKN